MKRIVKRFLPILLCLVVIGSIIWYLFSYDRGFTQDLLLGGAHFFEQYGNHSLATWFYEQAYFQSGNDDDVIIALANRFKQIGNYTQAEVVLSNAIAENASVELYLALSQTYVEQDKLLDAAHMLENVINADIKAQLEALRPSAPVATPAPGFYNQYLSVTIEADATVQLYTTTDGDFPSVEDRYQQSVALVGGENQIYAIAVGENGLVSAPAYFGYTVGGVIEEITISDPVLDRYFREMIGANAEKKLFTNDLWTITQLVVPAGVKDYTDLGRLAYLEMLEIKDAQLDNLQMLSTLTQLKHLSIQGTTLSAKDLEVIGNLPNLEILTLRDCSLSNISGLSGLAKAPKLTSLDLSGNAIRDLSALAFLQNLTVLDLHNNALTDLSPLSTLDKLTTLDVSYNSLTSIMPLTTCSALAGLIINNNQITEIPVFNDPTVLTILTASNNQLTSVDSLAKYTSLAGVSLSYNQLTDISALASLKMLVSVDFSHNQITKLPTWSKDSRLVVVDGSYNKITSVAPLRGLSMLNKVMLDYNKITNINPLAECYNLAQVDVYGNSIKDVSKLTAMSVIVNYKPK